jgi:hypothetical protein
MDTWSQNQGFGGEGEAEHVGHFLPSESDDGRSDELIMIRRQRFVMIHFSRSDRGRRFRENHTAIFTTFW